MRFLTVVLLIFLIFFFPIYFFISGQPKSLLPKINEFKLSNGISVIHIPNNKVPAVLLMFWVKAGGIDEADGKSGVAHYLEHIMFHGTSKFKGDEFQRLIERNGGYQNAFTSYDYTAYYSLIPKKFLPELISYEADRFMYPAFDVVKVEKEKDIILEERLSRLDNNIWQDFSLKMRQNLYGSDYPYAKPLIGYPEEIKNTKLEDLKDFFYKFYQPNNIFVIAAGDVAEEELKGLLETNFAKWEGKEVSRDDNALNNIKPEKKEFLHEENKTSYYAYVREYIFPNSAAKLLDQNYEILFLTYLLSGTEYAILPQEFVIDDKSLLEIDLSFDPLTRGVKSLTLSLIANSQDNLDNAVAKLDDFLITVPEKITQRDLNIAKEKIYKSSIYDLESYKTLGFQIGTAYASGMSIDQLKAESDKILAVKLHDIRQVALDVLTKTDYVAGYMIPKNN